MSQGQLGQMLEGVFKDGVADVNGRYFSVKTNGKTGMDIRYYINPVKSPQESTLPSDTQTQGDIIRGDEEPIGLSEIPF